MKAMNQRLRKIEAAAAQRHQTTTGRACRHVFWTPACPDHCKPTFDHADALAAIAPPSDPDKLRRLLEGVTP